MTNAQVERSEQSLPAFRNWLATSQLRKNTLLSYNFRIEAFLKYQKEHSEHAAEEISKRTALHYLEYLRSKNANPSTYNVTVAALAKLFEFFGEAFPVASRIERSTEPSKLYLTESEIDSFLLAVENHGSIKARVIALLCFHADLSAGQCIALDKDDIVPSVESNSCFVRVKKRKSLVELHGPSAQIVMAWYRYMQMERSAKSPALFLNEQGNRISRSGVDYLIKSVGIPARLLLSAQMLRNSGRHYRVMQKKRRLFS